MALAVSVGRVGRAVSRGSGGALSTRYLPIDEHGLTGDLHTVARRPDGTIDWYCCPGLLASVGRSIAG
jgi:hypothetical protein